MSAFRPSALFHLRASDRPQPESASGKAVRVFDDPLRRLKRIDADRRAVGSVPPPRLRVSLDGGDLLKPVEPEPIRQAIPWELLARDRASWQLSYMYSIWCVERTQVGRNCRVGGGRPVIPRVVRSVWPGVSTQSVVGARNGLSLWIRARVRRVKMRPKKPPSKPRTQISSRCSTPCFSTLPFVISLGIQSGLSSGASSSQAHPS